MVEFIVLLPRRGAAGRLRADGRERGDIAMPTML